MSNVNYENSYWCKNGKHKEWNTQLSKLVPLSGKCETLKGEIYRAAVKIYYDFFNNGFGNNWSAPAQFLINHVPLSNDVEQFLYDHGCGNCYDEVQSNYDMIEEVMNSTIEYLYSGDFTDTEEFEDMWETEVSDNFVEESYEYPDDEDYYYN